MSEIRNPGIKCGIRINKEAFKNFVSEKGSNLKEITEVLGISHGALYAMLNRGTFTVYMLYRLSSLFKVEPKDMEFIDDPAHKLLYQLCIPFDGPRQKGNKIARIREYLAQGLDRLKIRELLMSSTLTHSAVSEAFNNVANSEQKTIGQVITEHAEEISANTDVPYANLYDDDGEETHDSDTDSIDEVIDDLQKTLKERSKWVDDQRKIIGGMANHLSAREITSAQTLAKSIMVHIEQLSTLGSVKEDAKFKRLRDSRAREARMKNEYWVWKTSQGICKDFNLHVKERPWLETLWFFLNEAVLTKDQWPARGKIMIDQLKLETFSGRYMIEEEETENEGN